MLKFLKDVTPDQINLELEGKSDVGSTTDDGTFGVSNTRQLTSC